MADQPISFDRGVEILRGPDAACKIAMRRAALQLAAMPDPFDKPQLGDVEYAEGLLRDDPNASLIIDAYAQRAEAGGFLAPADFCRSIETWDLPAPDRGRDREL